MRTSISTASLADEQPEQLRSMFFKAVSLVGRNGGVEFLRIRESADIDCLQEDCQDSAPSMIARTYRTVAS